MPADAELQAQLREMARAALAEVVQETVQLRVDEDVAMVVFMDGHSVAVPLGSVVVNEGCVWVRVTEQLVADFPVDKVHVQVLHTIPKAEQVAQIVDGLDPALVNVLMAEISAAGAADESLGSIGLRAVVEALRGVPPGSKPPPDATLGE